MWTGERHRHADRDGVEVRRDQRIPSDETAEAVAIDVDRYARLRRCRLDEQRAERLDCNPDTEERVSAAIGCGAQGTRPTGLGRRDDPARVAEPHHIGVDIAVTGEIERRHRARSPARAVEAVDDDGDPTFRRRGNACG